MTVVEVTEDGRVALPAEARRALGVARGGGYLEAEVTEEGAVVLRPAAGAGRREGRPSDRLRALLAPTRYAGPGPEPSQDELMEVVVEEIGAARREGHGQGRP
jgi:AbrB family looped-hinge helix DNA binding protein